MQSRENRCVIGKVAQTKELAIAHLGDPLESAAYQQNLCNAEKTLNLGKARQKEQVTGNRR
jgi:hypothetical protein